MRKWQQCCAIFFFFFLHLSNCDLAVKELTYISRSNRHVKWKCAVAVTTIVASAKEREQHLVTQSVVPVLCHLNYWLCLLLEDSCNVIVIFGKPIVKMYFEPAEIPIMAHLYALLCEAIIRQQNFVCQNKTADLHMMINSCTDT